MNVMTKLRFELYPTDLLALHCVVKVLLLAAPFSWSVWRESRIVPNRSVTKSKDADSSLLA